MHGNLIDFLNELKSKPQIRGFDEAVTKQTIILPILQFLGWSIFDAEEVCPEFYVENRRVDYCLRLNNQNEFFLEVKRTGEDLDKHQEQLLEYAFRQGIELATLTNGITWLFYLPMKKGDWTARRFYTIDILEQDSAEVAKQFDKILSKQQIQSKDAIQYAEEICRGRLKKDATLHALPKAWNKIISEPDELLLELFSEVTEKICGFKPKEKLLTQFLKMNQQKFLVTESSSTVRPIAPIKEKPSSPSLAISKKEDITSFISIPELMKMKSRLVKAKPVRLRINEEEYKVKNWANVDEVFVTWLIDHGVLQKTQLPIYSSKKKYFINATDQHSLPDLDASWKRVKEHFWIDVKYNVPCHIKNINQALEQLNAKERVKVSLLIDTLG